MQELSQEDVIHTIQIVMTKHGQVVFNLPNDLIACYGLLEAAKDAAREQNKVRMQEANQAIAIASSMPNGHGLRRA